MANYAVGTPVTGAVIRFRKDGELVAKKVQVGDALTDVIVANYPTNIKLASATILGFTLKTFSYPRSSTAIFDGVPTYLRDFEGDHHFGTVEEVAEIDKLLIELPAESEDGAPKHRTLKLGRIVSFEGGEDVEVAGGKDNVTEDDPGAASTMGGNSGEVGEADGEPVI